MSCCRRRAPGFSQTATRSTYQCVNCFTSLREPVRKSIHDAAKTGHPGINRTTLTIKCECGYENRIPVIFERRL